MWISGYVEMWINMRKLWITLPVDKPVDMWKTNSVDMWITLWKMWINMLVDNYPVDMCKCG